MSFFRVWMLALIGALMISGPVRAQYNQSEAERFLTVSGQPDYIAIIDQLSLDDMRNTLLGIWVQGLNPRAYWTDDMEWAYQRNGNADKNLKARTNQEFLQMLQDLYSGSVDPQLVGFDIKFVQKNFLTTKQLQALLLAAGNSAGAIVEAVAPQNPPYLSVKEALKRIYPACSNGQWTPIKPSKKSLKLNVKDNVIIDIKKRLALLGYRFTNYDNLYDSDLLAAINDIQWNLRVKPDGVISPGGRTWTWFNVSCVDRVRQMQADMEKMRWFPQRFEDRYIFVNLAMTYFGMLDRKQNMSMAFRTINGRPERKSPTMRDEIVTVILNPSWVVPPTVFMQDKVEEIKNLPYWEINNYFNSHNYEVWNKNFTKRIDPSTIDWWGISQGTVAVDIYIRQKPHLGNALGVVKFELTNSFSIYLHDTNQRELFAEPQRQISSGCIRLEKPFDLAEYLLQGTQWTRQVIEATVAKPGEVLNKSTEISLKKEQRMPVYLAYLTSQMSSDGVIRFVIDSYDQNSDIRRYLASPF